MKRPCNACKHNAVCLLDPRGFPGVLFKLMERGVTVDQDANIDETAKVCEAMCRNAREKFLAQFPNDCCILPPAHCQLVKVTYHWAPGDSSGDVYVYMKVAWPTLTRGSFSIGSKDV